MIRPRGKPLALLMFSLLCSVVVWGQNTAELQGRVVDSSGHPAVSAFVIITSHDTSLIRAATTDDSGNFEFTSLPVGSYSLEVKADGFPNSQTRDLRASIGEVIRIGITLGGNNVLSAPRRGSGTSVVETSNTQLGVVMGELEITNLPLKSRDTYELLQLQPGVQSTLGADLFFGGDQPGVVSVNGGRARSNNYNVNGGHSGDQLVNSPSIQPSPDAISEFRVISHNYDAQLGRNAGSVINVVTKSGSNAFHGTGYEYFRNKVLNASGYFDPEKSDFKQNDFGGILGGAIRRDKTFFFSSYEGRRLRRGITSDLVTVPTGQEREGDFSAGPTFAGKLSDDAVATRLGSRSGCASAVAASGGAEIAMGSPYASIFPGNIIPPQCFDPTAADLMGEFIPLSNVAAQTFLSAPESKARQDQVTLRLDHNLTNQQQLSFYYYGADGFDSQPFARFQAAGANLPEFGSVTRDRFQQLNLSHNWMISGKTNNESRFVYYRGAQGRFQAPEHTRLVQNSCATVPEDQCFSDPTQPRLGITPGYGASREGVPFISLAGGFAIGNNANGSFAQTGNVYQVFDSVSKIIGRHSLKFGADVRNQRFHQTYFYNINGNFGFSGGGPNDVGFSNLVPNYLLGLPDTYSQGSANGVDVRTTQLSVFAQDAWKLKPNLTVDYGLRWELNTPQADAGKRIQAFRPGQATSIFHCELSPSDPLAATLGSNDCSPTGPGASVFPLGLVLPGDKGVPAALTNAYVKSLAPRVGLAWSPNWTGSWLAKLSGGPGKSSVRMGWGIFYDSNEELMLSSFAAQPPFGGSTIVSNVFFNTPFLGQNGTVTPNPFNGFSNPAPGSAVDFALFRPILLFGNFPETLRSQYAEQYHFTIQRQLPLDMMLQFGYVGSQGHRLIATLDQNFGNAQTCLDLNRIPGISCGPFGEDTAYPIPAGAIPPGVTLHLPYGSVPTVTGPNANPISLVGLRKYSSPLCEPTTGVGCPPDSVPVFSSLFAMVPIANSAYNSLQAQLTKRFSHGLQLSASYTWSKSIDTASSFENSINPNDAGRSRSPSLFDARHRFVLSGYWQLADWKVSNWSRHVVNGWAVSGISVLQSGFPIRIMSSGDQELMGSFDFETPGEPNQVAPLRRLDPVTSGGYYFDPASFVDAPLGQIGNAPRTVCCGPGIINFDFALHKTLLQRERTSLEFRTEFFNLFNHTQFFNPGGDVTGGTAFGLVSRARDPRLIQVALRLAF
jgi:outer membrane receptor protein involved in Fe transport